MKFALNIYTVRPLVHYHIHVRFSREQYDLVGKMATINQACSVIIPIINQACLCGLHD